jgi:hypothetical protein
MLNVECHAGSTGNAQESTRDNRSRHFMGYRDYFQRWRERPKVRPWALLGPVAVLLICLPLLRPLRHPARIGDDEAARLASVRALVERHTLWLTPEEAAALPAAQLLTVSAPQPIGPGESQAWRLQPRTCSNQPPVFSILLAGVYWIMLHCGNSFARNPVLVPYLLTLIGVTLPVAGAAGLIYRMGRQFELPRIRRAALGLAVVFGSGLISYAVVLNPFAPAAVLLLCAMGCVIHVAAVRKPRRAGGWLILAGLCAALGATFDPAALIPAVLIAGAVLTIRVPLMMRLGGVVLFVIGAVGPLALHAAMVLPIRADALIPRPLAGAIARVESTDSIDDEADAPAAVVARVAGRIYTALLGSHGVFSHFPVMLLGLAGVGAVMHRNWLPSTKALAAASAASMGGIIGLYCFSSLADWRDAMFAVKWFVVFSPMVLYWMGAWARRGHTRVEWSLAAALLFFSAGAALIGATGPCPPEGFDRYTVAGALQNLIRSEPRESHTGAMVNATRKAAS